MALRFFNQFMAGTLLLAAGACAPDGTSSGDGTDTGIKLSGIGDSIMQGFDAKPCGLPICFDQPEYSFAQGTDGSINSLYSRFGAPESEFVSITGAELIAGSDNGTEQAAAICKQKVRPNRIVVLLGSNDICNADSVAMLATPAEFSAALTSMLVTLTSEACGLAKASAIHVMSIPRVDLLTAVGGTKTDVDCNAVWKTYDICHIVTAATSGKTIATVAETVRGYNRAVADAVAQVAGAIDASRQLQLTTDYVGETPNTSFGTYEFASEDISSLDCFHPSEKGQKKIACMAWQTWEGDGDLSSSVD